MTFHRKTDSQAEAHPDRRHASAVAAEFHDMRIRRELKIEAKKESPIQPQGTDEYQQLVAEDADFNTKPMIEEAAFFLAEKHGFAPGNELADWLQAEADVESILRRTATDRRKLTIDD